KQPARVPGAGEHPALPGHVIAPARRDRRLTHLSGRAWVEPRLDREGDGGLDRQLVGHVDERVERANELARVAEATEARVDVRTAGAIEARGPGIGDARADALVHVPESHRDRVGLRWLDGGRRRSRWDRAHA